MATQYMLLLHAREIGQMKSTLYYLCSVPSFLYCFILRSDKETIYIRYIYIFLVLSKVI